MKIAYLGSRPLAKKILQFLLQEQEKKDKDYIDIVCLVTLKDHEAKPQGERWWKGSLIPLAKAHHIPIVPVQTIGSFRPDIIISVYYYEVLPEQIINLAPYGAINLHPGYIPNGLFHNKRTKNTYRGCGVLSWAILNQEKWQAVTFHYMTKKIDLGPVIEYAWNRIGPKTTVWDLQQKSEKKAYSLFVKWLPHLVKTEGLVKTLPPAQGKYPYFTNSALIPLKRIRLHWPIERIDRTIRAFDFPCREPAYIDRAKVNDTIKKIHFR